MSGHTIEDRGHRVKAANYALLVLGTLAVILRFCGRYIAHKAGFWWDDWLSLVALVSLSSTSSHTRLTRATPAVPLGGLWPFALLGIHRLRKTHR